MAICKTTNSGASWGTRKLLGLPGDSYTSCMDIAVAPGNSQIVYAVGQENRFVKVYNTNNAGNSWYDVTGNLTSMHGERDNVYAVWVSPDDPSKVLVGTSVGVFEKTGGSNWMPRSLDKATIAFTYNHASETLYAATMRDGVYYTRDNGISWRPLNNGLDCLETLCINVDSENGWLYVGTDGCGIWRLNLN